MSEHASTATAYLYLNSAEVQFLDAAVERLIPADELGPGAREAGVTAFIDGQLNSTWGTHGRNYRMGPWLEGTPQQGFQSPLTPQEIYRLVIPEINDYCRKQFGKIFAFLPPEQRDEVLRALEKGNIELESVSAPAFFGMLLKNTMEGFFSDPMYGGNRDKVGWKLVGFPGVASADYGNERTRYNVPYRVEPVSILDVAQKKVAVDAQGYPIHVRLDASSKEKR